MKETYVLMEGFVLSPIKESPKFEGFNSIRIDSDNGDSIISSLEFRDNRFNRFFKLGNEYEAIEERYLKLLTNQLEI